VERRRRIERKPKARRLNLPPVGRSRWPHIEELIECDGNISIGRIEPVTCAAVASDEHNMLAALVRRGGESFLALLARLDQAIDAAMNHETFTDEINR